MKNKKMARGVSRYMTTMLTVMLLLGYGHWSLASDAPPYDIEVIQDYPSRGYNNNGRIMSNERRITNDSSNNAGYCYCDRDNQNLIMPKKSPESYSTVNLSDGAKRVPTTSERRVPYLSMEHSQQIKRLQWMLQQLDYYKGKLDGVYGDETTKAVKSYFDDYRMKGDGTEIYLNQFRALEVLVDDKLNKYKQLYK